MRRRMAGGKRFLMVFLGFTVLAPIVLFTDRISISCVRSEITEGSANPQDLRSEMEKLNALRQEEEISATRRLARIVLSNNLTIPADDSMENVIEQVTGQPGTREHSSDSSAKNEEHKFEKSEKKTRSGKQRSSLTKNADGSHSDTSLAVPDIRVRNLRDQLIRARVFLSLSAIRTSGHYVKDLRARMRDVQRALGDATNDSELPKNANEKMREMEQTLARGKQIQDDCAAVIKKLRAMLHSAEEQLKAHRKQTVFLTQLAAKTVPKGLHCLPLRLTAEYFALDPSHRQLPGKDKISDPRLFHYALFSDNILATAVVINSTVHNAKEPADHVFHIVTDQLNYAAMRMWFISNPPKGAAVEVQNVDEFTWLNSSYSPVLKQLESRSAIEYYFRTHKANADANLKYRNPKYLSMMNHLRFYLPEIYPKLEKVVFLDDDVVVQKDLTGLWSIDMKGKVIGVVETCGESFHRFDRYLNFSNPAIAGKFDPRACGWAFGMNLFDLVEWRRQNITEVYHSWQRLNTDRLLWKLGTLPAGLITFWNRTLTLHPSWHVLGLGYNPHLNPRDIDRAAVAHYNGNLKPWLDIALPRFRHYWSKYLDFDHLFLRECNITP